MGHADVASGYPISTGFRRLMGCQRDLRDRGVTSLKVITNFYYNKLYYLSIKDVKSFLFFTDDDHLKFRILN